MSPGQRRPSEHVAAGASDPGRGGAAPSPPYPDNASAGAAICFAIDCHTRRAEVSYTQRYSPGAGHALHPVREQHVL